MKRKCLVNLLNKLFIILLFQIVLISQVSAESNLVTDYFQEGNTLFNQGKYDKAVNAYTQDISDYPSHLNTYFNRGICLTKLGKYNEAVLDFEKVLEERQKDKEIDNVYIKMADSLMALSRYREGLVYLEKLITKGNNLSWAYYQKGYALNELGRYSESNEAYSLAAKNGHSGTENNIGYNYFKMGKYDEALKYFDIAIKNSPEESMAYKNKARVYLLTGKNSEAIRILNSIKGANSDPIERDSSTAKWLKDNKYYNLSLKIYNALATSYPLNISILKDKSLLFYEWGKYTDALDTINKAIKIDFGDSDLFLKKGLYLSKLGKTKEAIENYNKSSELDPKNDGIYNNLGSCLVEISKFEEAVKMFDKAISLNPKASMYYKNKAYALLKLNKKSDAYDELYKDPDLPLKKSWKINSIADWMLEKADYRDSIALYDSVLKDDPNDYDAIIGKANVLYNTGQYDEAIEQYNKAGAVDKDIGDPVSGKAKCYYALAEYDEALKLYNSLISMYPYSPFYHAAKADILLKKGLPDQSVAEADKALNIDKSYTYGYERKYRALLKLNRYEQVIESCDKVLDEDARNNYAQVFKALALKKLGKIKDADEIINKIENEYSFSSEELYNKACVYALTGNSKLASDYLKKAIIKDEEKRYRAIYDGDLSEINNKFYSIKLFGGKSISTFYIFISAAFVLVAVVAITIIFKKRRIVKTSEKHIQ